MDDLLTEIETVLKNTGMSPSQFGDLAVGDRSFVFDLRDGRDLRLSTVKKVRAFIAKQETASA
jgi:predicted transcriptional regulator